MSDFNKLLESIDTRSMRSMMEALDEADTCDEDLSADIRKGNLKHDDELDAEYAKDGDTEVQFQDRKANSQTYDLKSHKWLDKQPRTASHTWGRVWKDGKMVKSMEGPKYQVRQDMARFLDGDKQEECVKEEAEGENLTEDCSMGVLIDKVKPALRSIIDECGFGSDDADKVKEALVAVAESIANELMFPLEEGKFADRAKKAAGAAKETNKIYKEIKKDPEKKGMSRQEKRRQAINDYLSMKGYNED